ncbi:hypothetical protein MIR68_012008 [Amoeboaphelidium protococcarum]|nr:hypothetical protein MIR68_011819 [Amoeboaphelidium protococcarum]KAI3630573.1 hypothetical protein MIR68_012008 [Amoeboaphelidium protococcarum]
MDMNEDEAMQAGPKKKGRPKKRQMQDKLVQQQVTTFKAFIWKNGVECCFVGFVSKVFQSLYDDALDGRVVLFAELVQDLITNLKKGAAVNIMVLLWD